MTPVFTVKTSPHFERLSKKLLKQNKTLRRVLDEAISVLESDPYNYSRRHAIKKLSGPQEDGQYRLSIGRWRFRYDIVVRTVELVLRSAA